MYFRVFFWHRIIDASRKPINISFEHYCNDSVIEMRMENGCLLLRSVGQLTFESYNYRSVLQLQVTFIEPIARHEQEIR